jgi:hypothetical protein
VSPIDLHLNSKDNPANTDFNGQKIPLQKPIDRPMERMQRRPNYGGFRSISMARPPVLISRFGDTIYIHVHTYMVDETVVVAVGKCRQVQRCLFTTDRQGRSHKANIHKPIRLSLYRQLKGQRSHANAAPKSLPTWEVGRKLRHGRSWAMLSISIHK